MTDGQVMQGPPETPEDRARRFPDVLRSYASTVDYYGGLIDSDFGPFLRRVADHLTTDLARLDTLQDLLSGADFDYGAPDEKRSVIVLDLPVGVRIGKDIRKFADDAAAIRSHAEPDTGGDR